ncbi:MAG: hypothetical protein GXO22_06110 [Aquificae bacterium]|nr:hypothetical protein [Aquificota bacterium]
MDKTPYAYEFLWKQLELGYQNIKKEKYKKLVSEFLFNQEIREKLETLKDYKGRNYKGGILERTASVMSLALCIYDNYPEIDIDLLLTAIILSGLCSAFSKKECYQKLKDFPQIIPFLYKKKRKKPSVEIYIYDQLFKIDNGIFLKLRKNLTKKKNDI